MKLITLPNSLRVFLNPVPTLRSATVGIWVASASGYEKEEKAGISHFIEHIVFKGSKKRTGFEIAEGMDEIGAHVNAYTTKEYTFFYTKALDYQILKAADILFDMIANPALQEKDIETEKGVVLEEIAMCEDDPADVCTELMERSCFEGTGFAIDILGTRKTVSEFSKEDIEKHMKKFYVPERMIVGVSGNYNEEEILSEIEKYFGKRECTENPLEATRLPFNQKMSLKKMDTEQTHISLSFEGIAIEDEKLYALQLAMFILGTGSSSMLNRRIREELGLVYSIDSWLGRYLGGGYIAVSLSLGAKSEKQAIRETLKILSEFPESITERKIAIAKEKLISGLIMSREQPQSRFSAMGHNLLFNKRFIEDDEIINKIKAVSLEDVKKAAREHIRLSKMSFTAVGRVRTAEEYSEILKDFAE